MKIARNVAVSGRHVEWYVPLVPGSLSEGAGSPQGLTEGVSSDGCFGSMVIRKPSWALKFLSFYVHRSTLPQSRFARQLPQGGSRDGLHHPSGYSLKSQVTGDFHRPYETLMILAYTIHRTTLPQSALRADSSLREGAGERSHSSGYSLKSRVTGDFHRPYEALRILAFAVQWGSPCGG